MKILSKLNEKVLLLSLSILLLSTNFVNSQTKNYLLEDVVKGCESFEIQKSKTKVVLLLHGLGGCPHEVSLVGESLAKNGYTVVAPRYPGHGSRGKVMSDYGWQEWYDVAEKEYLRLTEKYQDVYVLGFSTGGTLGLKLAEKYDIKKLVLLSPFIYISYKWYYVFRPETYLTTVGAFINDWPANMTLVHINDKEARDKYIRGDYFSFKATRSALELITDVKKYLSKVKSPVLIIHSKADETTDYTGSDFLYKTLQSKVKKFVTLNKSNHIIGLDYEKRKVFKEVNKFLDN